MGTALAGPLECPVSTDVSNVRSLHSRRIVRTALLLRTAFLEGSMSTPIGQWSEPRSLGQMKASFNRFIALGDART